MRPSEKSGLHRPRQFNRFGTLAVVVRNIVHASADGITSHLPSVVGLEHVGCRCHVSKSGIKPQVIARRRKNHRHPIVYVGQKLIGRRCQDCAGFQSRSAWLSPSLPQASKGERLPLHHLEAVGLFAFPGLLPFVEGIRRNEASPTLEEFSESWLLRGGLRASIDHASTDGCILSPVRDQAPSHERSTANGLLRILPDNGHGLSWSDVIAGLPVHSLVLRIEVARQNLSTPGESVASAHWCQLYLRRPVQLRKPDG